MLPRLNSDQTFQYYKDVVDVDVWTYAITYNVTFTEMKTLLSPVVVPCSHMHVKGAWYDVTIDTRTLCTFRGS